MDIMAKHSSDISNQKYPIDTDWFFARLEASGQSMRALARSMDLDPGAMSRMLNGARQMSAEEQDKLANFLGVNRDQIAAHRGTARQGFGEMEQATFERPNKSGASLTDKSPKRHPAFGSMKGTTIVMPGVDLTQPADPDWGKVYND